MRALAEIHGNVNVALADECVVPAEVPPPPVKPLMLPGRAGLMCANPKCWFLCREDEAFGGYCCKKCHWCESTPMSKSKKRHGKQCAQIHAPEDAPRAPPEPPSEPVTGPKMYWEDQEENGHVHMNADQIGGAVGSRYNSRPATAGYPQQDVLIYVRIRGFVEHAAFNGLRAYIDSDTPDGRFNLRLADGTTLRWVKKDNFDILPPVVNAPLQGPTTAAPPPTSPPPPPPPPGPPPGAPPRGPPPPPG